MGYVLERLIGAMTVQQKMDALKEEKSPGTPDEEEPQDSELALKPVEEVSALLVSHA